MPNIKLLARPEVEEMTGLTRSSIYRLMRARAIFPNAVEDRAKGRQMGAG